MFGGVHRLSRGHRIACTGTHFSELRFGLSYECGIRDRNCKVCLRTKVTRALCRRRTGEALPRAEKFGDVITADHKVLNEEGESRNNHRYAVVVQDLATQWSQSYPCKQKRSQVTEQSSQKFLEPSQKKKELFIVTFHWNMENLVNIHHGIIEHQHLIDPRQMALLKEPSDERKKELQQYCYNQGWMKDGGLILWNAIAICDMSKTCGQKGKLR